MRKNTILKSGIILLLLLFLIGAGVGPSFSMNNQSSEHKNQTVNERDTQNQEEKCFQDPLRGANPEPENWPMFKKNLERTGYSTQPSAPETNMVNWTYQVGILPEHRIHSSPAVVDGRVYLGAKDGRLYCIDAYTGEEYWKKPVHLPIASSPAVHDGKVYIGEGDESLDRGDVYCFNATDGELIWNFSTEGPIWNSPAIAEINGEPRVYVGSGGIVYCLNATGDGYGSTEVIWEYTEPYTCMWIYSPAIAEIDGEPRVFVGAGNANKILCLNATGRFDGTTDLIWSYPTDLGVYTCPAVYDEKIYINSWNQAYCLDAKGNIDQTTDLIWSYYIDGNVYSSPAVAYNNVYFGSYNGNFYCLNATGNGDQTTTLMWSSQIGATYRCSPAIADEKVYIGAGLKVYCLDAINGSQIWNYYAGSFFYSSPAIYDSRLYIGSNNRWVYCFAGESNDPPETPYRPSGPLEGYVCIPYSFSTNTTDPDGHNVQYGWDFTGNGHVDKWTGFYPSGETVTTEHMWTQWNGGDFEIRVKAKDIHGMESNWSQNLTIHIYQNQPPEIPSQPAGPSEGYIDILYNFTTSTIDPEGHDIRYGWDFTGNGHVDKWTGYYLSGEPVIANYSWTEPGEYEIRVKARDFNNESDWSEPLLIEISEELFSELEISEITHARFGLGVIATIKNVGNAEATGINCTITVTGGLLKITTEMISNLAVNEEVAVRSGIVLGLGPIDISVTADCIEGSYVENHAEGKVFFIFTRVRVNDYIGGIL